ncbi:hypothetical protein LTR87_014763 [Friedmanniomyces endolithicus]|nr:hypothetical protein LTR75_014893 [Friedmanniomyces endolithicus]KAK0833540.1 hypothetical protein LTR03_014680 [Friedmanniomyces endolithicus]KAK0866995.1 hypothetical protein LTR87_014763 [Friedmanniomyces endolithicus]
MSETIVESRKHGVKGQRIPGKPGRFDPSEPMHMTTRRRAKGGVVNDSPSTNGSNNDDHSPRGSLDENRPLSSYSLPSQTSPEILQHTNTADMTTTPAHSLTDTGLILPPLEITEDASVSSSDDIPAVSPSRKRKRESRSPPSTPPAQVNMTATQESELEEDTAQPQSDAEDAVELINPSQLSDREESFDDADSESEGQPDEEIAVATGSLDMSPAGSAEESPASSVSQPEEQSTAKPLDAMVDELMPDVGDEVLPEIVDVDDLDDVDDQVMTDDDDRPVIRKFGGKRRRAAHPLKGVEMRMRRQLETKKAYRVIARELKAVLAEISQRSLDQVASSEGKYVEATEFQDVQAGLDAALEKRNALVRAQHKLNMGLLKQSLQIQEQVRRTESQFIIENAQDTACDRLQHDFLTIARKAQLHDKPNNNATEDEDEIVPRPKRVAYGFKRGDALDHVYESRSRQALETERSMKDMQCRLLMRKMLQAMPEDDDEAIHPPFAVMDRTPRDAAEARSKEVNSIGMLAAAADEAERIASIPKIRNEDAHGLQLLSDLCVRPSILAPAITAPKINVAPEPAVHKTPPRPPPQHVESPHQMNSGISVAVSPAAHQFIREREGYEPSMPPPRTPRQGEATFGSPFSTPRGQRARASSTTHSERPNGPLPIAARLQEPEIQLEQSPVQRSAPVHHDRTGFPPSGSPETPRQQPPQPSPHRSIPNSDPVKVKGSTKARRTKNVIKRPSVDLTSSTPALPEQLHAVERAPADQQRRPELPPNGHLRSLSYNGPMVHDRPRSRTLAERPSMPHLEPSAISSRSILGTGVPETLRSRATSLSIKDESPAGDRPPELRFQQQQPWHQKKTNKAERGGESRRAKGRKKKEIEKVHHQPASGRATHGPRPAQPPSVPFTSIQGGPESRPWHVPAPQPPQSRPPPSLMPPPPFAQHYSLPRPQVSSPPHDFHHFHEHQSQGHRNSFPPPTAPPTDYGPPPPRWNGPPPPSPLYAIPPPPHRPYQPPPPGAEQYQPRPPPPPPLFEQQHQHQRPPMTPPPLSTLIAYGPQYGGPPIAPAPAMPDPRLQPPGFRPGPHNHPPAHPPAFAQQRGPEAPRRRTQSDVHLRSSSWRSYEPGGRR